MLNKDQTVAILQRLHSDRQAATNFVRDPASEWQALGGQLPAGVTPAQFSQRVRGGSLFKAAEATANGQMSVMSGTPCQTAVIFVAEMLGLGGVTAVTWLTAGADIPLAAFLGADLTVVQGILTGVGGTATMGIIAAALCHGT
jgi:hypothetical protein